MALLAASDFGFYLGLAIGFAIVTVVVALVAVILTFASRVAEQVPIAIAAVEETVGNTSLLPAVAVANEHAVAILEDAKAARGALTG